MLKNREYLLGFCILEYNILTLRVDNMKFIYFGASFGLTMAASLYVCYQGGSWLDARFATEPIFSLLGILVGVVLSFKSLVDRLNLIEKMDKEKKK